MKLARSLALNSLVISSIFLALTNLEGFSISQEALNHYNRGIGFETQQDYKLAENEYRIAIGLDAYDNLVYLRLAQLLIKQGNTNEALSLYKQSLNVKPEDSMVHLSIANLLEEQGQYQKALSHYQQLLKKKPEYTYGYLGLARLYVKLNQPQKAFNYYKQFLQNYPNHFDAQREKAALHVQTKQFGKAAETFATLKQGNQEKFSDNLAFAYALNQSDNPQQALEVLENTQPKTTAIFEQIGFSLEKLKRPTEAYNAYNKAVSMAPNLKYNLYLKMADMAILQNRIDKAKNNLEKYLQYDPKNTKVTKGLADIYLKENQYEQASSLYKNILNTSKQFNPDILKNLGYAYQMQGKTDNAIEIYEHAIASNESDFQTRVNLALAYHKTMRYEKALKLYTQLTEENPHIKTLKQDMVEVQLALANQAYDNKDYEQSEKFFQDAYGFSDNPQQRSQALLGLGNTQYATHSETQAYETYQKSVKEDTDNQFARLNKAKIDLERQNYMEALESLREVHKAQPNNEEVLTLLANTHENLGDYGQALLYYEHKLKLQPYNAKTLLSYGNILHSVGDLDKAQQSYELARNNSPQNALIRYNLASVYNQKNLLDASIREYREAIHLNPSFVESYYGLGNSLEKKENYDEALMEYQNYIKKAPPTSAYLDKAKERILFLQRSQN